MLFVINSCNSNTFTIYQGKSTSFSPNPVYHRNLVTIFFNSFDSIQIASISLLVRHVSVITAISIASHLKSASNFSLFFIDWVLSNISHNLQLCLIPLFGIHGNILKLSNITPVGFMIFCKSSCFAPLTAFFFFLIWVHVLILLLQMEIVYISYHD